MKREEKLIETIEGGDEKGNGITILKYQEYIVADGERLPSLQRYQLQDGSAVNMIDASTFQIVKSGVTVKRR
ncbi:hypothetical protein IQ22_02805 [Pseudomonas duriflava]|uniref:Uncharacterized protein n=1 Tax=Pseudomonas duriflava TaxID=459528 RepID=A0A562Q9X7_9PSED|nr:hypothetical protein [Pseudomonas duriflava]TWI52970.1 hypothetical protein IQ22_02805 [Pseudomonas duriflava]